MASRAFERESSGKAQGLAAHAVLQPANEIPLIEDVLPAFERANAGLELHHRRNRADGAQLWGWRIGVVARQLQRKIAAERVARDDDLLDVVCRREFTNHVVGVRRQP